MPVVRYGVFSVPPRETVEASHHQRQEFLGLEGEKVGQGRVVRGMKIVCVYVCS